MSGSRPQTPVSRRGALDFLALTPPSNNNNVNNNYVNNSGRSSPMHEMDTQSPRRSPRGYARSPSNQQRSTRGTPAFRPLEQQDVTGANNNTRVPFRSPLFFSSLLPSSQTSPGAGITSARGMAKGDADLQAGSGRNVRNGSLAEPFQFVGAPRMPKSVLRPISLVQRKLRSYFGTGAGTRKPRLAHHTPTSAARTPNRITVVSGNRPAKRSSPSDEERSKRRRVAPTIFEPDTNSVYTGTPTKKGAEGSLDIEGVDRVGSIDAESSNSIHDSTPSKKPNTQQPVTRNNGSSTTTESTKRILDIINSMAPTPVSRLPRTKNPAFTKEDGPLSPFGKGIVRPKVDAPPQQIVEPEVGSADKMEDSPKSKTKLEIKHDNIIRDHIASTITLSKGKKRTIDAVTEDDNETDRKETQLRSGNTFTFSPATKIEKRKVTFVGKSYGLPFDLNEDDDDDDDDDEEEEDDDNDDEKAMESENSSEEDLTKKDTHLTENTAMKDVVSPIKKPAFSFASGSLFDTQKKNSLEDLTSSKTTSSSPFIFSSLKPKPKEVASNDEDKMEFKFKEAKIIVLDATTAKTSNIPSTFTFRDATVLK